MWFKNYENWHSGRGEYKKNLIFQISEVLVQRNIKLTILKKERIQTSLVFLRHQDELHQVPPPWRGSCVREATRGGAQWRMWRAPRTLCSRGGNCERGSLREV